MCKHLLLISLPFHDLSSINDTCMNHLFHCGLQNCYFLILSHFLYELAFLFLLIFITVQLLYSVVLVSAAQQSESIIHTHIPILFQISFSLSSPQSTEQSSLYSTESSHQFSILRIVVYIWRRHWHPTPVFFPGGSNGQRNLVGKSKGSQRAGHN